MNANSESSGRTNPSAGITYPLADGTETVLPLVVGVMGDFLGSTAEQTPLTERQFIRITCDDFDSVLRSLQPRLELLVDDAQDARNHVLIRLSFESIKDFEPARLATRVEPLRELHRGRAELCQRLDNARQSEEVADEPIGDFDRLLEQPPATSTTPQPLEPAHGSEEPGSDQSSGSILDDVLNVTERTLGNPPSSDPGARQPVRRRTSSSRATRVLESQIRDIDRIISRQMAAITAAPEFQTLATAWRGLHYLTRAAKSVARVEIHLLPCSQKEFERDLRKEDLDESDVFAIVYDRQLYEPGKFPLDMIVADYAFDHSNVSMTVLGEMAEVAMTSFCPFVCSATADFLNLSDWTELPNGRQLVSLFQGPGYVPWRTLRKKEESRFLTLTLPPLEVPWETSGSDHADTSDGSAESAREQFGWTVPVNSRSLMNTAWLVAGRAIDAFASYGWCATGDEAGPVRLDLLPATATSDPPYTSPKFSVEQVSALASLGLAAPAHVIGAGAGIVVPTIHQPGQYSEQAATDDAKVAATLGYSLAFSRWVRSLMAIAMQYHGRLGRQDMEARLQQWVQQYVRAPSDATAGARLEHPLDDAQVSFVRQPRSDHTFLKVRLRPFMNESSSPSMQLTVPLPFAL